jgi:hypothetical protein
VPDLVRRRGSDPDLRFLRVNSPPRSSQTVATNDSVPGGRGAVRAQRLGKVFA